MANDAKIKYGSHSQAISITLANLSGISARQSNVIDNSSDLFLDALVSLKIKSPSSVTNSYCLVFAYGTVNGGTDYTGGASGSDSAYTFDGNLTHVLGIIYMPGASTTYKGGPWSIASAFGGTMPQKWGIVFVNNSGAALDLTEANFTKTYQGIYAQIS